MDQETKPPLRLRLPDEAATDRLGVTLAGALLPGDTMLLRGGLGAGKSALARAVIRTLLGNPGAEVPSPSYTLVNVYETSAGPVWHVDLYRLIGESDEMAELGLSDALDRTLVLIEWPERLGKGLPQRWLEIALDRPAEGGRSALIRAAGPDWQRVINAVEAL